MWAADYFKGSYVGSKVSAPPFSPRGWGKETNGATPAANILTTLPPKDLMRHEASARAAWTVAQIGDLGRPGLLLVNQGPRCESPAHRTWVDQ
jgi:hypothetical protein